MSQPFTYLHIQPEAALPAASIRLPTRVVVVADSEVSAKWQEAVGNWLVQSGCLYMMAWGDNCSSWDDSVDVANIKEFKFGEIPPVFAPADWIAAFARMTVSDSVKPINLSKLPASPRNTCAASYTFNSTRHRLASPLRRLATIRQ
jgi:hypothetical protein